MSMDVSNDRRGMRGRGDNKFARGRGEQFNERFITELRSELSGTLPAIVGEDSTNCIFQSSGTVLHRYFVSQMIQDYVEE